MKEQGPFHLLNYYSVFLILREKGESVALFIDVQVELDKERLGFGVRERIPLYSTGIFFLLLERDFPAYIKNHRIE